MIKALTQPLIAFRISLVAGLAILALSIASVLQEPPVPCGPLKSNYAPIIAFELARTESDLQAVFGSEPSECRTILIAKMDGVTLIDMFVFVPVYGLFLLCFMLAMRSRDLQLANAGIALTVLAVVADYVENACLMQLTPALDAGSVWFALLPWATGIKWLALGGISAAAGSIYVKRRPRNILAAVLCLLSFAVTIAAIAAPATFGSILSPGVAVGWLTFFLTAAAGAFRKSN